MTREDCAKIIFHAVIGGIWSDPVFSRCREVCLAAADRILAAQQEGAWQAIETAPKDGSRVLAWHQDWETSHTAQWYGSYWGSFYENGPFLYQPTHWQPLPVPPQS